MPPWGKRALIPLAFTFTIFTSASLLFLMEPMIAKMILPLLGGTPAVWNTCMMFFQFLLLAGYLYAHLVSSRATTRQQVVLQCTLLALAAVVLPVAISKQSMPYGVVNPIAIVLILLSISIGFPFFILSSSTPLLQRWFVETGHPASGNPYFLYSASNAGSLLALISYPVLVEPNFTLKEQSLIWTAGYGLLFTSTIVCAATVWPSLSKARPEASTGSAAGPLKDDCPAGYIGPALRLRWIALAFVPSSLMLGVTSYLATDVASVPLFWVVPLSLYLLSFIIVFAKLPESAHRTTLRLLPISVLLLLAMNFSLIKLPLWLIFTANLSGLFISAMACHGELARSKPAARKLTEFYLCLSLGGVLGGIFNAVIAPAVFKSVVEYPLALALGALLVPIRGKEAGEQNKWLRTAFDLLLPLAPSALLVWLSLKQTLYGLDFSAMETSLGLEKDAAAPLLTCLVPAMLSYCLVFLKRPKRFGFSVVAIAVAFLLLSDWDRDVIHKERSFFGVLRVLNNPSGPVHTLVHGSTKHGEQNLNTYLRYVPMAYYHPSGPVGQIFGAFKSAQQSAPLAVIGLGTGSLAGLYPDPNQLLTFYEIDPAVVRIATDPALFTYMKDSVARWNIVVGDARLKIEEAPDRSYGLIVVDAFSSDSIPVHLLTKEAIRLYLAKLNDAGLIAFHISNRYLDLEPVLKKLADDDGLAARIAIDEKRYEEKLASIWVVLARRDEDLGALADWKRLRERSGVAVWTDDFSNILRIFK